MSLSINAPTYTAHVAIKSLGQIFYEYQRDLFPSPVQRKVGVWSKKAKISFILLCIHKRYFGEITISLRDKTLFNLDGLQRISTIFDFISNKFALVSDDPYYDGKFFRDFEHEEQEEIKSREIRVLIFSGMTIKDEAEQFGIANAGTALNNPEKRFAVLPPKYREFINDLLAHDLFNRMYQSKNLEDKRCKRSEFPLRIVAINSLIENGLSTEEMYAEKVQTICESTNMSSIIKQDEAYITNTLLLINNLLGDDAFIVRQSVKLSCADVLCSIFRTNQEICVTEYLSPKEVMNLRSCVENWKKVDSDLSQTVNYNRHSKMINSLLSRIGKYVAKLPVEEVPVYKGCSNEYSNEYSNSLIEVDNHLSEKSRKALASL